MTAWQMALRNVRRDWHTPELRILALALIVAVAAVTAVSFFTDRIYRVISLQGAELLAADLRLSANQPFDPNFQQYALSQGLQTAELITFPSVILHNDETALTAIKAATEGYPLRGNLRIADAPYAPDQATQTLPTPGSLWLEPRLFTQFNLNIGDYLTIGSARLQISGVLTYEPDRGGMFAQLAPRVLLNQADLAATELIGPGSRVKYHLLIAGPQDVVNRYRTWLEPQLIADQSLETLADARPELRMAIERADRFLSLAALVAVILAGAAVAVAAQHFSNKQADVSAIMRCLGATQRFVFQVYVIRLFLLGLFASLLGCLLGWLAQLGLASLLASFLGTHSLPAPSWYPLLLGLATGLITLPGFALPPVLKIHAVPPLRVLRHDIGTTPPRVWQVFGLALLAISILMIWQAGDLTLAIAVISGTLMTLSLLLLAAWGLIAALSLLRENAGVTWRFGLANLARRAQSSSVQLAAFGLGIMALLLLAIVRVDLLDAWQSNLAQNTPNHFAVNIQPDDLAAFKTALADNTIENTGFFPMAVGRFIAINDKTLHVDDFDNPRAQRMLERTFNLSSGNVLSPDNQIVAGEFWQHGATGQVSVEKDFAELFNMQLGDILHFRVGGQAVHAEVTSLRSVQWDSFNVNFFVLGTPDLTENLPRTYVTSFYLADSANKIIPQLIRQFPSVTIFDLNVIMHQVRSIMERATLAVQYVFLFTLLAGIMVLYAAISASQDERLYESALLRTLGATRPQVLSGLLAEFTTLGLLAGVLAATMAALLGAVLAVYIFELPYHFNVWLWIVGAVGGGLGVGLAGVLGTYHVLNKPPLTRLRLG